MRLFKSTKETEAPSSKLPGSKFVGFWIDETENELITLEAIRRGVTKSQFFREFVCPWVKENLQVSDELIAEVIKNAYHVWKWETRYMGDNKSITDFKTAFDRELKWRNISEPTRKLFIQKVDEYVKELNK